MHFLHDLRHVCPFGARFCNKDGKGQIEAAKCMGCGICAAECPAPRHPVAPFRDRPVPVMIKQLFAGETQWNRE